ncbi:ABC transporter permease [Stratiformator vulcanicus]|uniref:Inner membrane transport permease YadH n=1 Tax=Stratiformator vulcanicus TaxID=2527980 RepID=A0A517R5B4_9PLAN|nr:ABC transporter permease [Stratiformator vulcanicus]QDT39013.1 Inner membrane transport permease YadH [Stratiformator vulcanicus]
MAGSERIQSDDLPSEPARPAKGINFDSLGQLTLCRIREFYREPEIIFWMVIFPILMAGGLGLAFRSQPQDAVQVATTDEAIARKLSDQASVDVELLDSDAANRALATGKVLVVVSPDNDGVSYRFDDTNPEARVARLILDNALQQASGRSDVLATSEDFVREPGSRYIDFLIPGLLGLNIMGGSIWGIGFTIVDTRRRKLLKRLVASPMPRWQYLLSFLISRLVLLVIEVGVVIAFATLVFGVPMRGPIWEFVLLCVLGSFSFSALGILIAARPRTIEAVSGVMNFVMLPMWICSGVFFSPERFPEVVLPLIRLLPLTAVIDALRANMLRGESLLGMEWQLAVMVGWLVLCFPLALWLFRWK